jgi:subtilisin family serine protease
MSSLLSAALETSWQGLAERNLTPVDVAILDSGVDGTHPALSGRLAEAWSVDTSGSAATLIPMPIANNDLFGHGTAVGSIIAHIAPNARLYDVRVLGRTNTGAEEALIAGFEHAVNRGWTVLNLSLAARDTVREPLSRLCERAYYRGQIVVAARRNLPIGGDGLPAELSACIGVDLGEFEVPHLFGFRMGYPIELVAVGKGVSAAAAGGGWTTMTGTSFATPAISGLCALLLGAYPGLQPYEIKGVLRAKARAITDQKSV